MIGSLAAASASSAAAPSMMSLLGPAALIGGLGFAGSMLSMQNQSSANSKALKWQRYNMQHAHQWEVEDLRKAGLNPILSAGGSGAVAGSVPNAPLPAIEFGDISSGIQMASSIQSIKESQARIDLLKEQKTSESGKPQNIIGDLKQSIVDNGQDIKKNAIPTIKEIGKLAGDGVANKIVDMVRQNKLNSAKTVERQKNAPLNTIDGQIGLRRKLRDYDEKGRYMDESYDWR